LRYFLSQRLLVAIVLISVAVALLLASLMLRGEPPDLKNSPPQPTPQPTVDPAVACAVPDNVVDVECSAACGRLPSEIRWRFDDSERTLLERQYWRACSQLGPPQEPCCPLPVATNGTWRS
jgi:hypothetical protein